LDRFADGNRLTNEQVVEQPRELRDLQKKYISAPLNVTRQTVEEFIRKLEAIKTQLTIEAKLDEATAAQREIDKIQQTYKLPAAKPPPTETAQGTVDNVEVCERDIEAGLTKIREAYQREIYSLKSQLQQEGDLDNTLAVEKEWKRCIYDKSLSAKDVVNQPAALRAIQTKYLDAFSKLVGRVVQLHLDSLAETRKKLTIDGKFDEARAVQKDIEKIRTSHAPPPPPKETQSASYDSAAIECDKEIQDRITQLREQYLKELTALGMSFQSQGELKRVLAVKNEQERFARVQSIGERDLVEEPEELAKLQTKYQEAPDHVARETAIRHMKKLVDVKKKLTIDGKLDQAIAVQKQIDAISAKYEVTEDDLVEEAETPPAEITLQENATEAVVGRSDGRPMSGKWTASSGAKFTVGQETVLQGPGGGGDAPSLAFFPSASGNSYAVSGEIFVRGYAGFVLGYNPADGTFVSLYSGNGGTEMWQHRSTGRSIVNAPSLSWPRGSWEKFRLIKRNNDYTLTIGSNTANFSAPSVIQGSISGLLAYYSDEVRIRDLNISRRAAAGATDPQRVLTPTPYGTISATGGSQKLKIIKATYGKDNNVVDVTQQLQALVINDTVNAGRGWDLCHCDPVFGTVKETRVIYSYRGRRMEKVFGENEAVKLP